MNLDAVIAQLRGEAVRFEGRVAGAASFAVGLEGEAAMALPAAYVVPLDEEAGENEELPGLRQIIIERIGVIVELDNAVPSVGDRRGQVPAMQIDDLRAEIFAAILNWRPGPATLPSARGFAYAGGRLLEFDRARLFYQFEFELETTVTDSDGYQAPVEDLEEIDIFATSADGAVTITGASAGNLQD